MPTTSQIQQLYVAYYGRPADPGGLAYWTGRLEENGGNLGEVISAFATSDEFEDRFGSLTEQELINNLYQQIFGRPAEGEGLAFYAGMLARGDSSLIELALDITNGAQGDDSLVVQKRVEVANKFTQDVAERGLRYGAEEIEAAGQIVASVAANTNVAEYIRSAVNDMLNTLPAADNAGPGEGEDPKDEAPSTGGGGGVTTYNFTLEEALERSSMPSRYNIITHDDEGNSLSVTDSFTSLKEAGKRGEQVHEILAGARNLPRDGSVSEDGIDLLNKLFQDLFIYEIILDNDELGSINVFDGLALFYADKVSVGGDDKQLSDLGYTLADTADWLMDITLGLDPAENELFVHASKVVVEGDIAPVQLSRLVCDYGVDPDKLIAHQIVYLQTLLGDEEIIYTTVAGDDQFIAESADALGNGITINAGAGWDSLYASVETLSEYPGNYLMPTLNSIEGVFLEPVAAEDGPGASILLTRAPDVELVANVLAQSNLTVTDVQSQVDLSVIYTTAESPRDFAVRYAEKVEHDDVQYINLNDADINLLTITKLKYVDDTGYESVSAGVKELDVFLYQNDSSIASFTESSDDEFNLSDSVELITLNGWANLSLGEVWDGLTVDMSNLKGTGEDDIDLDLSSASIASSETVTVKVAEFDAEANNKSDLAEIAKSDQAIKLPDLAKINGTLVIENFTIATGSGEDAVVNDVLDFSASPGYASVEAAAAAVTITASEGLGNFMTLTVSFESDVKLVLENVIGNSIWDSFLSTDALTDGVEDGQLNEAGEVVLIGLMVNESTFEGLITEA